MGEKTAQRKTKLVENYNSDLIRYAIVGSRLLRWEKGDRSRQGYTMADRFYLSQNLAHVLKQVLSTQGRALKATDTAYRATNYLTRMADCCSSQIVPI